MCFLFSLLFFMFLFWGEGLRTFLCLGFADYWSVGCLCSVCRVSEFVFFVKAVLRLGASGLEQFRFMAFASS